MILLCDLGGFFLEGIICFTMVKKSYRIEKESNQVCKFYSFRGFFLPFLYTLKLITDDQETRSYRTEALRSSK